MKNKLIIVAGCSGSGKSTVSKRIKNSFGKNDAQIICMDRFYKCCAAVMPKVKKTGNPNFDHPDAFDWKLLRKSLKDLLNGKTIKAPIYNYKIHKREKKTHEIKPTKILIFEGFLALYDKVIKEMADLKIFVNTPLNLCFQRRLVRDQKERRRTKESINQQWNESVVPMYKKYVQPHIWSADILLPWDKENHNSIKYVLPAIKKLKVR